MSTEPGAVATGSHISTCITNSEQKDLSEAVECLNPVATALDAVNTLS